METWLDLHMHTKYSMDGQFEPADLMRQCAQAGVTTVAVTDHDSVRAIPEARDEAARLGLNLVPGIEISCQYEGKNFHLLGYGIHAEDTVFAAIEKD
ncbi:MAG: PHP domain-containing protein, partial [Megasphaera elsdenii]|nr:PHP domain-containing protein [Megasphaera elsdenii]